MHAPKATLTLDAAVAPIILLPHSARITAAPRLEPRDLMLPFFRYATPPPTAQRGKDGNEASHLISTPVRIQIVRFADDAFPFEAPLTCQESSKNKCP
jgi:hypothetical protein